MRLIITLVMSVLSVGVFAHNEQYVLKTCSKIYKGDCGLIASIAYVESKYKTKAFNPEGSYGLMQIRCSTAKMMGFIGDCRNLFDPHTNIKYAVKYVENIKKRFSNFSDIIASYNSGTPIICKDYNHGKCSPGQYYNQKYVDKVMLKYMVLKLALPEKSHLAKIN
jgi:soluble lytic murein transglycosylase-like protein